MSVYKGQNGQFPGSAEIPRINQQSKLTWNELYLSTVSRKTIPHGLEASNVRRTTQAGEEIEFQRSRFDTTSFKLIGETNFYTLYTAAHATLGTVVLKKFADKTFTDLIWKEFDLMKQLHHENVSKLYGAFFEGSPFLVLDACVGPLGSFLETLNDEITGQLFMDTLQGINYLHSKGLIHCKLEPNSVLLHSSGKFILSDFTHAFMLPSGAKQIKLGIEFGNPAYLNLEALEEQLYSKQTDLWSFICLMFKVSTMEDFVVPPGIGSNFATCSEVIRNGYPVLTTQGFRELEPLSERVRRSKYAKYLSPLFPWNETSVETYLEIEEICHLNNNLAARPYSSKREFRKWLKTCEKLDTPSQLESAIFTNSANNFVAFVHFYYDANINLAEQTSSSSASLQERTNAQTMLDNFEDIYDGLINGGIQTVETAKTIVDSFLNYGIDNTLDF